MNYPTIEDAIGKTPLVALQRIGAAENKQRGNVVLGKLEGNNPAGSVKDRPALAMIKRAEERGEIKPGDTLIEATSGNTGIALAMAAAIRGYRMVLIMPEDLSVERAQTMKAYGAELLLTPKSGGMEYARDLGYCAAKVLIEGGKDLMVSMQGGRFVPVPFSTMIDPKTGRTKVRLVDIRSERYAIARRYMIRLRRDDFEDPHQLAKIASAAGVTLEAFRGEFGHLIRLEPPPLTVEHGQLVEERM